jgi:elongation factor Ts
MAEITAQMVKQLRERTGAGFMDCKKALEEAGGSVADAETALRKRGIDVARKKAGREAREGLIGTYVHPGSKLGVLVEVNCESDFVARTDVFIELVHDIAMHIAATDPRFIRKEEVSQEAIDKEREIQRARALAEGKPEKIVDKIVDGRMAKFYEEICLYEQPFVKENASTVGEVIAAQIAKLGENIRVSRMARFKVGEVEESAEAGGEEPAAAPAA